MSNTADETVGLENIPSTSAVKRAHPKSKSKSSGAVSSILSDNAEVEFESLTSEKSVAPKKTRLVKDKKKANPSAPLRRRNSLPTNVYHDQYRPNKENEVSDDVDPGNASKEDNVSIFRHNLLIQKSNQSIQTKILHLQMSKVEMDLKISELELKKAERLNEIEINKKEELAKMELEKQEQLKKKELEKYDELAKLEIEAKRKQLGL